MALVLKEKICLMTSQGTSEVQLLFGDITQLPLEDKVDTIMVSAFPGDYSPLPSTMIGSLKRNLGVLVNELAKDKDVNLLHNFNCWVSKPLPENVPFRRLVCFERINRTETLPQQISGMFRAMMPVFNNQDTSVITPLLAAGSQGNSKQDVLLSIVTAACQWIKAGLPLRCLKIVVYMKNTSAVSDSERNLLRQFTQYKSQWEGKSQKVLSQKKTYDVCLSFSKGDESHVQKILKCLLKEGSKKPIIHAEGFTYNYKTVWQEQIFSVMANSQRILIVITPNYVSKPECLEQFHLALCCNRLTEENILAPFYVETVLSFPSYMTLIQYTECRARKPEEVAEEKIAQGCSMLISDLHQDIEESQMEPSSKSSQTKVENSIADGGVYDIFISYAHRSPTVATRLYETLQDISPPPKVFFDKNELKTGNVWQESLYEAVDSARIVVTVISQSYLHSTVCQEEYNIALARFLTDDGLFLIPMLTEDITEVPPWLALTPFVDVRDLSHDSNNYKEIADILMKYLKQVYKKNRFSKPAKKVKLFPALDQWRRHDFRQRFQLDSFFIKLKKDFQNTQSDTVKTVVLSFTNDCLHQAAFLCHLLREQSIMKIKVEFLVAEQGKGAQGPNLQVLDTADMTVVIVSDDYLVSTQHRNELHIALCRQRVSKDRRVLYLIQANHGKLPPVYAHILPHSINLGDRFWFAVAREAGRLKSSETAKVDISAGVDMSAKCSGVEYMALQTAAVDIIEKLAQADALQESGVPVNIMNLAIMNSLGEQGPLPLEKCLLPFDALKDKLTQDPELERYKDHNMELHKKALREAKLMAELEKMMSPSSKSSSTCTML